MLSVRICSSMVYDAFLFYNELELLDIRLNTLNDVVDKFVLVEATVTHTNQSKPLYYQENKARFKKFHKKIIHIIVKDSPNVSFAWIIERFQLEATTRGLKNCKQNDIILYGAVDEIPSPEKIKEYKDKPGIHKAFLMKLSYYFLNCVAQNVEDWRGTSMFLYKDLKKFKEIYFTRYIPVDVLIPDGGWHFSYMGGLRRMQTKISSMAHQEYNTHKLNSSENLKIAINSLSDFARPWIKFAIVDTSFLPIYVQKNFKKFTDLIADKNLVNNVITKLWIHYWKMKRAVKLRYLNMRLKV